ncbi:MAG: inositol-3-phosphate synthase [Canidatus Methanoxibalbensis ujae]|nr:inositol-3-phosphate synthase [Candidatus Methanoxibalbensis ujae]MCW7078051.1 inositol-3-phosphate synthase [Candidatus Methanoxibalbensis ujae]
MRTAIFGQGYVASILAVGLQRIKEGEIGYDGIPLTDIPKSIEDIEIVLSFDVDEQKVGRRLSEVVRSYWSVEMRFENDYTVNMGYSRGSANEDLEETVWRLVDEYERADVEIFVNLITTENVRPFYNAAELEKAIKENLYDRVSPSQLYFYSVTQYERPSVFINCIPAQIANDPACVDLARRNFCVIFGDDGASGATPLTADILEHMRQRGRRVLCISQFNIGGNSDFLSLMEPDRNQAKETTKSSIVRDILGYDVPHFIKPTGYLEPLGDKKFVAMHIPYISFNGAEDEIMIVARINDSPALAGMIIDLIRLGKIAIERGEYGTIYPINAFYMKMPGPREAKSIPKIFAFEMVKSWIGYESVDIGSREREEVAEPDSREA